jgi:hypothetical protein
MLCPVCRVQAALRGHYCEYCQAPLREEHGRLEVQYPAIQPGPVLVSLDLRSECPPGWSTRVKNMDGGTSFMPEGRGIAVKVAPRTSLPFVQDGIRARDLVVRSAAITFSPVAYIAVAARREAVGAAETQYTFDIDPSKRAARLIRRYATAKVAGVNELVPWTEHRAILGVGELNHLEIRVQGPAIEGWVNGQPCLRVYDPVYGIGYTAVMCCNPTDEPQNFVVCGFEVRTVAA